MNLYVHKTPVKEQLLGSYTLSLVIVGTQTGLVIWVVFTAKCKGMLIRFMALVINNYSYGSGSPHPLGVW